MKSINYLINYLKTIKKQNDELLWRNVWLDTIKGVEWAENVKNISPGRMAVGYNYLFILTHILLSMKPITVLEFGLGISSKFITGYFNSINDINASHIIIEQDKDWGEYYTKNNKLSKHSTVIIKEVTKKKIKKYSFTSFENLDSVLLNKKFSVISIDGPTGSDYYSRRDILEYLPDILEDDFAILIHDSQRSGEKRTIDEIKTILSENKIKFFSGRYSSLSDCDIIVSQNYKFLCSM